jgi:1-acyl-sn-glycerol-3-phosphate acyltransferase
MTLPTLLHPLWPRVILHNLRATTYLTPWLLHLLASDIVLSLLLPISFVAPTVTYHLSSNIAYWVWYGVQVVFTKVNKARITTSGDNLPQHESAIVVCNHVSWTDFYLIQELALKSNMLGYCRWFAKQQLKWVPFLGWGLWAMGMPLISRNWDRDQNELRRVFRGPQHYRWPMWLISYSEATRFTPQKYLQTVQWCKEKGKPIPRYALYPRTKGFVATVRELRTSSSIKAVYDLTIAYAHRGRFLEAPTMWETLSQPRLDQDWQFHVHSQRFDISEFVDKSDDELVSWLEDRWMAKSRTLEGLQKELDTIGRWTDATEESSKKTD